MDPAAAEVAATEEVPDEIVAPSHSAAISQDADTEPVPGPEGDARSWSGDMYDEGDETDPSDVFAAYKGAYGDEAWHDQAPDGTLTG
ncbi:hypothetical protein [Streptomyces sp. WAC 01529]|uniref:hypothetical protein n=1 Tax=Streptomyces sp. WAC 01529 TaxID=2203205 RepID=UPI000F74819D|nr:hypothetical protein [Streptomyces sp. WAC 01529]